MIDWIRRGFVMLTLGWALALSLAPAMRAAGESGTPAHRLSSLAYAAGAVICHQRPDRSFHLSGLPMPVCARCSGIYAGAALVVAVLLLPLSVGRTPWRVPGPGTARAIAVASLLPSGATLAYEWATGHMPTHAIRAAAGVPIGAVVAWLVLGATRRDGQSE